MLSAWTWRSVSVPVLVFASALTMLYRVIGLFQLPFACGLLQAVCLEGRVRNDAQGQPEYHQESISRVDKHFPGP